MRCGPTVRPAGRQPGTHATVQPSEWKPVTSDGSCDVGRASARRASSVVDVRTSAGRLPARGADARNADRRGRRTRRQDRLGRAVVHATSFGRAEIHRWSSRDRRPGRVHRRGRLPCRDRLRRAPDPHGWDTSSLRRFSGLGICVVGRPWSTTRLGKPGAHLPRASRRATARPYRLLPMRPRWVSWNDVGSLRP